MHTKGLKQFIITCILTIYVVIAGAAESQLIVINNKYAGITVEEAVEIAVEAYVYAYPLVLLETTKRVMTNVAQPTEFGHAPVNQFGSMKQFPDATFTDVVRPNADTLYSILWFDVSDEPLVIEIPDSNGRYYLLPMLDMWTDVFASPGSRTTGNGKQVFVIANSTWQGSIPDGAALLRSPTNGGWVIGRVKTDGVDDYPNVWKFQEKLTATPLSAYGQPYTPPLGVVNKNQDMSSPADQVANLSALEFFQLFCDITVKNPPHANDYPILARMSRIGLEPGKFFSVTNAEVIKALTVTPVTARERIIKRASQAGIVANGWRIRLDGIGTYGTDYLSRASVAYFGLGANTVEDAVYPSALQDVSGKPFASDKKYLLHFNKNQLPPVNGFWSLTMYNAKQLFAANSINRYAIGDRNKLAFNADGSLDIYIQRASPGANKESNWLPTPAEGNFSMNLRLYWPKFTVIDQNWIPPAVKSVK